MRRIVPPLLLLAACNGDDPGDSGTGLGKLSLTFRIDSDYQASMDEPAVGTFYGALWRADEVTGLGPNEDAVDLGSIEIPDIDLQGDSEYIEQPWVSPDLPVIEVVVLGFLDSDANADPENADPDPRDPVTLPNENDFVVVDGETTEVQVFFGFLYPD